MAQQLTPVDVNTMPELAQLADDVAQTRRPRLLQRNGKDLAVLMPAPLERRAHERMPRLNTAEAVAIVERTAGILKQYRREPPMTAEQEREAFERAVAEQVAEGQNVGQS